MADNNSSVGTRVVQINDRVIIVQILVSVFICINMFLIVTFFKNECFHTTARYILFFMTLLSDSFILFMSDMLLAFSYFQFTIQVWLCALISIFVLLYMLVTPVTLAAMTIECYVAICMPLRHAELCSQRRTMHCILIIHSISSVPCIVTLSSFFASASLDWYKQWRICTVEMFILNSWQDHFRSAVHQLYFFIMSVIIVFSYVKIMTLAKAASGDNKKSTWKGVRTVILHGFQLLLCVIRMWCPFIESAVLQVNIRIFNDVRYFDYIFFSLAPKCLSPLIYGLRDEKFFHALKNVLFGI